jgi:hypothetical protein
MNLNALKEIGMQVAKKISSKMGEFAKDFGEELLNEYVKNDKWKDTSKKFLKHKIDDYLISKSHKEQEEVSLHNIHPLKFELLSKDKFLSAIKTYTIPNATGLAALRKKGRDAYYIYTAFVINDNLIEQENNQYLIFIADGLSIDLENLFGANELIVLQ